MPGIVYQMPQRTIRLLSHRATGSAFNAEKTKPPPAGERLDVSAWIEIRNCA